MVVCLKINSRAYIFTIDFIIAFFIVILLLGIALSYLELIQINTRTLEQEHTRNIALTASEILVMNPMWICMVGLGNYTIPNCINTSSLTQGMQLKSLLAIPTEYSYELIIDGNPYGSDSSIYNNEPCFTITRKVGFNITTDDSWPTSKKDLVLRVWRTVE